MVNSIIVWLMSVCGELYIVWLMCVCGELYIVWLMCVCGEQYYSVANECVW